jgi:hypothetical protein
VSAAWNAVHVYLPREAFDTWAPVDAEHIRNDLYLIVDCRGEPDNPGAASISLPPGPLWRPVPAQAARYLELTGSIASPC